MGLSIGTEPVETEVTVQMSRTMGAEPRWLMRITDNRSGIMIAEIHIPVENFSDLMSTSPAEATGTIYKTPHHGKYLEVKTYEVRLPDNHHRDEVWELFITKQAALCEDNGWRLDADKKYNMHRANDGMYRFTARRWV